MELITIEYGSDRHKEEIRLRDQALRAPLGLKFKKKDLESEVKEMRFGLLDNNGKLVACLLIKVLNRSIVKLRQMAVEEEVRRQGVGKELIQKVETEIRKQNFKHIELHARMYAKLFYEKLGYAESGDIFFEVGLPHIKMTKDI